MRSFAAWSVLLAICLALCTPRMALAADAVLKPGQEGPLIVNGGSKPCVLYIPSDYKTSKPCPLILFMHAAGEAPRSAPFRQITGGKGYIVCGLSYGGQADAGAGGIHSEPPDVAHAVAFIATVRQTLSQRYAIDQTHVLLTGLGMGGWGVNFYGFGKDTAKLYCGFCVIAAGPSKDVLDFTPLAGKPVLFLNGANDDNVELTKADRQRFKTTSGAIITEVVVPGEGSVPSTDKMRPPIAAWLAQAGTQAAREQSLAAMHWTMAKPAGDLDQGTDKVVLASWLQGLKEVQHTWTDKPVIIFVSATGQPSADGGPDATSQVVDKAFSYPAAIYTPIAARDYNCIQLDVSGVDKTQNRLLNAETAPMVLLLDKDRKLVAQLKGHGRLSDKGIADEMRRLLGRPQLDSLDALGQQIAPILKDMRERARRIHSLQEQRSKLDATPPGDASAQKQKQDDLDEVQKRLDKEQTAYDALADKLIAATKQD